MLRIMFTQFYMSGSYVTDPISTKCEHVTHTSAIRTIQLPTAMTDQMWVYALIRTSQTFP